MGKRGRPPVLDEAKRREILAIITVGCSRTMAATYVGCAVSTIQNTAERDAIFAEKLRQATYNTEVGLLKSIRNAAQKEEYWRAAAWALERRFPERYARRGAHVMTLDQIALLLGQLSDIVAAEVPDRCRKRVLKRLEDLTRGLGDSAANNRQRLENLTDELSNLPGKAADEPQ